MPVKKFLIFAPAFREDDGGGVVLHRLCALLNELGHEAYVTRLFDGEPVYPNNFIKPLFTLLRRGVWRRFSKYKTNPAWSTPVLKSPGMPMGDDWVVIYPEIIFGNPLQAKNVVRWFLFRPGFHTGRIFYGQDEYHVDFNDFVGDFYFPGTYKSKSILNVLSFPFEHYNLEGALSCHSREGSAYCLRKGKDKPIQHELRDSILIDGKSHAEVAAIFKRVKRFISYDAYTAYSSFAVLCGAESVVVPDVGVDKEYWYPDVADRYGVAYGFDDSEWAHSTSDRVLLRMKEKESRSKENVRLFAEHVMGYFDNKEVC
jgi:hypothetical protein